MSLGSIIVRLTMNTADFDTDTKRAAKIAEKRAKEIDAAFAKAGAAIGLALGAGLAIAGRAIGQSIVRMDELSKTAQKVGLPTEELSALAYAAGLADVELGDLQGGLSKLTKFQSDAAQGTEKNIALFEALGIAFRNADGSLRNTGDVLRDFADIFAQLPDGASKSALALDVFGRSGANLIPLLNSGSAGLDDMTSEAERFGAVVSTEAGRAAEEFNDNLTRLKTAFGGVATQVAIDLLPDLVKLTEEFVGNAAEGNKVAETADMISTAFRDTAEFGVKVFNVLKAMTLGAVGFYAKVGELQQKFTAFRFLPGAEGNAQAFSDLSAVSFAGADEALARVMNGPAVEAPESGGSSGSPNGRGRGIKVQIDDTRDLNDALNEYYASRQNASAADKAAAEAARAAAEAQRELERILAEGNEAREGLSETIAQNAAQMAGPAAIAAKAYADELVRLIGEEDKLRAAKMLTADTERELSIARTQAFDIYQEELAAIEEERTRGYTQLMADLEFELSLIGMTNLEREKAIALRYANVDAASAEGKAIAGMIEEIDEAARQQEGIDFLKGELKGLFVDLTDGVGSAKDALNDFFDTLKIRALQALADNLIEKLFDGFGKKSSPSSTGSGFEGFFDFIGSLFGGPRAGGGPVSAGHAYTVGENGKELFVPSTSGVIVPAGETARASRMVGRGNTTIQILGSTSRRALDRVEIDQNRRARRESARTG